MGAEERQKAMENDRMKRVLHQQIADDTAKARAQVARMKQEQERVRAENDAMLRQRRERVDQEQREDRERQQEYEANETAKEAARQKGLADTAMLIKAKMEQGARAVQAAGDRAKAVERRVELEAERY